MNESRAPRPDAGGKRRERRARRSYEIKCDSCGAKDTVPFKPKPGRKVFCRSCLNQGRPTTPSKRLFDITCSHCGAKDQVPFEPFPGSVVLCKTCLDNPNVQRVGGRVLHKVICMACGAEDLVPFKPDPGSRVLCRNCHQSERDAKAKAKEHFAVKHPNEVYGTKVRIDIRCDRCGTEDTLPFVPKTTGPILCQQCAQQTFGEEWALRHKVGEQKEFPFTCTRCSRTDFVPFRPEPGRELLCKRCFNEHAVPHAEGATQEENERISPYLFVRRKDD